MFKQLEDTLLTNYASTRLNAEEKMQLVNIAAKCGKSQSVILREAFRLYLTQSSLTMHKKTGGCRRSLQEFAKTTTRPQN